MATVTRRDRLVDLAALLVILLGIGLYLDGAARLRNISQLTYRHPGPAGVRQLDVADRARYESNAGLALAVVGCLVGAVSAARVVRRARGATPPVS
jgi:hypothetical protein